LIFLDRTANLALSERESQYEQQIKEYQSNVNQASNETDKIRTELKQLYEENISKEQQTNHLINTLKQDCEKLQIELAELDNRG
jgi:phage shock protein A